MVALERTFLKRNALFDLTLAYEDVFKYQEKVVRRLQAKLGEWRQKKKKKKCVTQKKRLYIFIIIFLF
jgi:hypothetical protein